MAQAVKAPTAGTASEQHEGSGLIVRVFTNLRHRVPSKAEVAVNPGNKAKGAAAFRNYDPTEDFHSGTIGISGHNTVAEQLADIREQLVKLIRWIGGGVRELLRSWFQPHK